MTAVEVAPTLEVTFDASGAAEAGRRGRVVVIVDVIDSSTTAEAVVEVGAALVLGAAPSDFRGPVTVRPDLVADLAVEEARRRDATVLVVSEPRIASHEERAGRAAAVTAALDAAAIPHDVLPNQGAEVCSLAEFSGRVVVIVSAAGGVAFDAALTAGAAEACFATTGRVFGKTGWEVARVGALRAIEMAREHGTGLSVVASSANSADDVISAFEIARAIVGEGFLRA